MFYEVQLEDRNEVKTVHVKKVPGDRSKSPLITNLWFYTHDPTSNTNSKVTKIRGSRLSRSFTFIHYICVHVYMVLLLYM